MGSGIALVTGAAGFIGQHLVEALAARGRTVRGLDDERSGDWSRSEAPVERITTSLEELSATRLDELCDGVEAVYHLAAEKYNSPRATAETIVAVNVVATQRLFAAAARAGVRKVVFTSSLYAYGSLGPEPMRESDLPAPTTVYGVSKLAGEHLLRVAERDRDLNWTAARLFFIYGPRQFAEGGYKSVIVSNFERIRRGERPTVYGDGEQILDYVHVGDCIEALLGMEADEHHGRTFNVASGQGISINDLTRTMLDVAGSKLHPVQGPADWTQGTTRVGDTRLAARVLKWTASMPIEEGVATVWKWLSEVETT
jgi:UDP-glucose 4-epimerase